MFSNLKIIERANAVKQQVELLSVTSLSHMGGLSIPYFVSILCTFLIIHIGYIA